MINSSIEQKGLSLAIDKRFLELEDLTAVRNQNTNNKSLKMIDVDAPLEYSAVNVLLREPGGDDPITSFNIIADEGIFKARNNRMDFMRSFQQKVSMNFG